MFTLPDLRPLFWLAVIGVAALMIGAAALLYWLWSHISWVP